MRWLRWHHRLNGHKFEQTQGDGKGRETCSLWGRRGLDMTEQLNKNNLFSKRNDAAGEDLETWKPKCSRWDIEQHGHCGEQRAGTSES